MTEDVGDAIRALMSPGVLASRAEVIGRASRVPNSPGIYAWYFDVAPPGVPLGGVHRWEDRFLLYVGISPRRPRLGDGRASAGTLRSRLRSHFRGNASTSTLRMSLGSLLHADLGLRLHPTGTTGRLTFGDGEDRLSDWMARNSAVSWVEHPEPWHVEDAIVASVPLRLNLSQNAHGDFYEQLKDARAELRARSVGSSR